MTIFTHIVVGAAAGSVLGNPLLAFLAGTLSHFFFDWTPHPDTEPGDDPIKKKEFYLPVSFAVSMLILFGSVATLFYLAVFGSAAAMVGALGGGLVDYVLLPLPQIRNSWIGRWHLAIQHHSHSYYAIIFEATIFILALIIYFRFI